MLWKRIAGLKPVQLLMVYELQNLLTICLATRWLHHQHQQLSMQRYEMPNYQFSPLENAPAHLTVWKQCTS